MSDKRFKPTIPRCMICGHPLVKAIVDEQLVVSCRVCFEGKDTELSAIIDGTLRVAK